MSDPREPRNLRPDGSSPHNPDDLAAERERAEALDRLLDDVRAAERAADTPDPAQFLAELRARVQTQSLRPRVATRRVRWSWAALIPLAFVLYVFFGPRAEEPVSVADAEVMEILTLLTEGGDLDPGLIQDLAPDTLDLLEDWRDFNDPDVQLALEDG